MPKPAALLKKHVSALWKRFRRARKQSPVRLSTLEEYAASAPNPQATLDIFQGEWAAHLPGALASMRAGEAALFEDQRLAWGVTELGGVVGQSILELGPLEGGHSYMLEQLGAASVTAVEANRRAYLKCLMVKELLGLQRVRFLFGDAIEFLRGSSTRYDLCVAGGILYHLENPVELIELAARHTDRLYLWTHYFDAGLLARNPYMLSRFIDTRSAEHAGFRHVQHRHEYREALEMPGYCGGRASTCCWLSREDILACLRHFGFQDIRIGCEEPDAVQGPCFAIAAKKS